MIAAGGALFNSWRIARIAGRVDALEATMRTVLTLAAVRTTLDAARDREREQRENGRLTGP